MVGFLLERKRTKNEKWTFGLSATNDRANTGETASNIKQQKLVLKTLQFLNYWEAVSIVWNSKN